MDHTFLLVSWTISERKKSVQILSYFTLKLPQGLIVSVVVAKSCNREKFTSTKYLLKLLNNPPLFRHKFGIFFVFFVDLLSLAYHSSSTILSNGRHCSFSSFALPFIAMMLYLFSFRKYLSSRTHLIGVQNLPGCIVNLSFSLDFMSV